MNVTDLLKINTKNLVQAQHDGLQEYAVTKLRSIADRISNAEYESLLEDLEESPSGDGYGCDNRYISFNELDLNGEDGTDIGCVLDALINISSQCSPIKAVEDMDDE